MHFLIICCYFWLVFCGQVQTCFLHTGEERVGFIWDRSSALVSRSGQTSALRPQCYGPLLCRTWSPLWPSAFGHLFNKTHHLPCASFFLMKNPSRNTSWFTCLELSLTHLGNLSTISINLDPQEELCNHHTARLQAETDRLQTPTVTNKVVCIYICGRVCSVLCSTFWCGGDRPSVSIDLEQESVVFVGDLVD